MALFSRCEASQRFEPAPRCSAARRARTPAEDAGLVSALAGFAEDLGILFRYAAGLDYYGRDRSGQNR